MEQSVSDDLHAARVLLSEQNVVDARRFGLAKRVVMRGSRMFTHRLVAAAGRLADSVQKLDERQRAAVDDIHRDLASTRDTATQAREHVDAVARDLELRAGHRSEQLTAELAGVAEQVQAAGATLATVQAAVQSLQGRLAAAEKAAAHQRSELKRTRTTVRRLTRGGTDPDAPETSASPPVEWTADALDEQGYLDFEERFRGSKDEIRARQLDAVPYLGDLQPGHGPLLDLACGRGEWVEILGANGIEAYGVDSNAAMIAEAAASGLDVRHEDALTHLAKLAESSLQGISAFHFVEHIPLGVLVKMLDDSLLALRPGGILLLETPNPTNLMVGSASFYLDPTHVRPIHPEFLRFLVESRGFVDVHVHYVHPAVPAATMIESGPPQGYADARLDRVVSAVETFVYGPQDYVLTARRAEVAAP
ncbi:MAG TPA: class I SAM-dependent methyltransferase [Nakamurella multipartita]|nr:class I SAM-dependent methyltransferase [Nakamurella multipartita]